MKRDSGKDLSSILTTECGNSTPVSDSGPLIRAQQPVLATYLGYFPELVLNTDQGCLHRSLMEMSGPCAQRSGHHVSDPYPSG